MQPCSLLDRVAWLHSWAKFGRTRSCPNFIVGSLIRTGPRASTVVINHGTAIASLTVTISAATEIANCGTMEELVALAGRGLASTSDHQPDIQLGGSRRQQRWPAILPPSTSSSFSPANASTTRCKKAVRRWLQLEIADYLQAPPLPQPRDLSGLSGSSLWGQDDDVDGDNGKDKDNDKGGGARVGEGKGGEGCPRCPCGAALANVTPNRVGGRGAQSSGNSGNNNKHRAGSILRASPRLAKRRGRAAKENDGGDGSNDKDDNGGDNGESPLLLSLKRCRCCWDNGNGDVDATDGGGCIGGGGGGASAAGAYYKVDEILDHRIKDRLGSRGTGQAVEYLVR
jgi:hypothetical protein